MKNRSIRLTPLFVCVAALVVIAGCAKKTEDAKTGTAADPHDVPMTDAEKKTLRDEVSTWGQALAHIRQFRDTIQKETTGGVPAKAHRSLDKLDLVLEWLPEIAQQSGIPKKQWQIIGANAQQLRELFNKVHQNIDDKQPPNYEAVAADIDKTVQALEAVKTK